MADLPPRPVFTRTISFGNVVQIATLLLAVGAGWATLNGELGNVGEDVEAVSARVDDGAAQRAAVEVRVRALEIEAARADERYSQLVTMIAAIRDSIIRLEQLRE